METRLVLLHGFSKDEALAVMRVVKTAVTEPDGIAFAATTASNMDWKVADLVEHVSEEHAAFLASKRP
ncbi:MAG: DUF3783 domain-containing protein [Spirochaetes bacterium]|nr:DUF3783 domain-containing protein [Spirochaetota bacterium]